MVDADEEILAVPGSYLESAKDLSDYSFQKFATTYFQSSATHQYSKRPLKSSLLPLQTFADEQVNIIPPLK